MIRISALAMSLASLLAVSSGELYTGGFFMAIASPLTSVAGMRAFPGAFKMFQPFAGGTRFVVLQAFGWAAYAFAVLGVIVLLSNPSSLHLGGEFMSAFLMGFARRRFSIVASMFLIPRKHIMLGEVPKRAYASATALIVTASVAFLPLFIMDAKPSLCSAGSIGCRVAFIISVTTTLHARLQHLSQLAASLNRLEAAPTFLSREALLHF